MKQFAVILILALLTPVYSQERKESGNLITQSIPEIPKRIAERMNQYQNTRSAALVDWDPTGTGLLIATRFGDTTQLHHVAQPGGDRRQITFFEEPVTTGKYSTIEPGFLFLMDEGGGEFFQLFWYDTKKGSYHRISDGGRTVYRNFQWSTKGDRSSFSSTKRNGKDFDLYVMNGTDTSSIKLLKQVSGEWETLDWSDDDSNIVAKHDVSINERYLYVIDSTSGKTTPINPGKEKIKIAYGDAVFSKDGKGLFYSSDEDGEFHQLTYYELATGKKRILAEHPWNVSSIKISRDGDWLGYTINERGVSKLYLLSTVEGGPGKRIEVPQGVIGGLLFDQSSSRLGFHISSATMPSDVYSYDLKNAKLERWTFSEVGGLNAENFISPELIEFPTFDRVEGKQRSIPAFYYKPRGNKRFPVLIHIHGGPESQSFASFNAFYQYLLNELEIAVLVPNVRGSSGYGKTYLMLDNGIKREDSVQDIGSLLDWIGKEPSLDPRRVAVYGSSYGGFMVLSSLTHFSDRIRCGVDIVGISNFVTFLESTEEYRRDLRRPEYGDERDPKMREFLKSISPLTNASKIKSPLFVIQGKNDPRVPISESEQIVKTVHQQGVPVWYLIGKDEGHGFKKKPNIDFMQNAVTLFLEEHLLK